MVTGFGNEVRELVRQRAAWTCEVQARCQGRAMGWELHHRRPRGMGSTRRPETNQPANALGCCADCHRFIEHHRETARANGWLLRQTQLPEAVPVLRRHVWVWLDNDGGVERAKCICGEIGTGGRFEPVQCVCVEGD